MEQIILPKNIFLPHFEIVQNFHYFVRSAPVDFLSKIQFSKKCLKCCRNVSFDEPKKYFLTPFWDSTKFSLFCKVRACGTNEWNKFCQKIFSRDSTNFSLFCKVRTCWFSVKNSIFQKVSQMLQKCFFWWVEQIILQKNIFLPHFEIVQNFHYFVRDAPVDFLSKI